MNLDKKIKGFSTISLILLIVIVLAVGVVVWFYYSAKSNPSTSVTNTQSQTPSAKITDLAPGVPNSQKTAVLVMHSDSSYEKFLLDKNNVINFIKSLPEGDRVISTTPVSQ